MTEHDFEMIFDSLIKAYYVYTQQHMQYALIFAVVTIILGALLLYKCYSNITKLSASQNFIAMFYLLLTAFSLLWILHMLSSIHDILIYGVFYNIHL